MNSLAKLDASKPRFLGVTRLSRSSDNGGSREIVDRLRAILESIEINLSNDETHLPHLEQQVQDWESLHKEALNSVSALLDHSRKSFRGHVAMESVLFGTTF